MSKQDNLQWLICHKTKLNQIQHRKGNLADVTFAYLETWNKSVVN